jgi:regulation of enolase protein 1 (concanavalin A-like superfamily)
MLPRLSKSISDDFAIKTRIGKEKLGGLFIVSDKNGVFLQKLCCMGRPIVLSTTDTNWVRSYGALATDWLALRLERRGKVFRVYCRGDDDQWYSCGWTEMDLDAPIALGIFASCPEDNSENVGQAVTSFDYFRIYRE